jgi:Flp pilus assembly protein TadG
MKLIPLKVSNACRTFWSDRRGNVAIIFGLALVPIIGLVGAAVDYSRANNARVKLQAAIDSTALMLAPDAATLYATGGQAAVTAKANAYFDSMYKEPHAANSVTTVFDGNQRTLQLAANTNVANTPFYKMFSRAMGGNQQNMPIGSSGMVKWGSRLRIALVLDTTGSMDDDGKMTALKNAVAGTNGAIDALSALNLGEGDVYISIIPFAMHVNGDPANSGAAWIDWTEWEAPPQNAGTLSGNLGPGSDCPFPSNGSKGYVCTKGPANAPDCIPGYTTNGCASNNKIPSSGLICPSVDLGNVRPSKALRYYNGCWNSSPTWSCTGSSCSCGLKSNCTCNGSGSSKVCIQTPYTHTWVPNDHDTWTGCIMDRGSAAGPTTSTTAGPDQQAGDANATYPADQPLMVPCTSPVRGLKNDWAAMKTFVNGLNPNNSTNQPIGLVWGWQSLKGGGPLTAPAKVNGYDYDEIIILLSDGLNTADRWYGNGYSPESKVDDRMAGATGTCQNIKNPPTPGARGITIYTIQVNTGGDPVSTLLRNCASDPGKFFHLTQAGQMPDTFKQIVRDISKLRVAR